MKALQILKYGKPPQLNIVEIPKITHRDQVLVKMSYAPINPSDAYFTYG